MSGRGGCGKGLLEVLTPNSFRSKSSVFVGGCYVAEQRLNLDLTAPRHITKRIYCSIKLSVIYLGLKFHICVQRYTFHIKAWVD